MRNNKICLIGLLRSHALPHAQTSDQGWGHYFMSLPLSRCSPLFPPPTHTHTHSSLLLNNCTTQRTLTLLCSLCLHVQVPQCFVILIISLCTVPSPVGLFDDWLIDWLWNQPKGWLHANYNVEARLADTTVSSPVIRRRMPAANSHPVWVRRNRFPKYPVKIHLSPTHSSGERKHTFDAETRHILSVSYASS